MMEGSGEGTFDGAKRNLVFLVQTTFLQELNAKYFMLHKIPLIHEKRCDYPGYCIIVLRCE